MAYLAVGSLPVLLAALSGPVSIKTLPAGVLGVPAFFGSMVKILASLALDRFLQGSVFLAAVFHSNGEAIFEQVVPLGLVVIFILLMSRLLWADLILWNLSFPFLVMSSALMWVGKFTTTTWRAVLGFALWSSWWASHRNWYVWIRW